MNLKENSRIEFGQTGPYSFESINTGCLQRIADATEKMAPSFSKWGVILDKPEHTEV